MRRAAVGLQIVKHKIRLYWPLIKSLQTFLLLATGLAGYMSARCPIFNLSTLLGLSGSLFLAIGGSTVLNMWWDRDIDARMGRTQKRPLPTGEVSSQETLRLGLILSVAGLAWSAFLSPLYALVVFAGWFFDVVVYTIWLKRRTCWSIVWGGIAGGMPILAGRVLGTGSIDWIGILLSLSVLFWIPTHILTFAMRFISDYQNAGVPTFPSCYGFSVTRATIAASSVLAAFAIGTASILIGVQWGFVRLLVVLSSGLLLLALGSLLRPNERVNFGLFKYASLYMLASMILLSIQ
ncbi:MAG: Heme O synthase, protoheme IX farnesyltransferase [Anaerolineae bacterium]|nr:MAG: Heme O synthase, protoheme IX farnesyltransferase [Anaerolineae bacterium]